jgi:sigma-B regulation protein RsbU (phosphoserine phosphatase)
MASFPGLPIGRLLLDAQFRIVEVDDTFSAQFGDASALVGEPLDEIVSSRDRRGAHALATKLNQYRGDALDLSLVITVAKREHFVRLRMVSVEGKLLAYIEPGDRDGSLTYELALARQRWQGVLQRSDEGIVLLDRWGSVLEHNQRFHELMDFRTPRGVPLTEEALRGRVLASMLPADFTELARGLYANDEEMSVRVEHRGRSLEIDVRTLRLPLRGRLETLVIVRDQSEQRMIAERDATIQADLEQAASFQRALISGVRAPDSIELDVTYRPLHRVGGDVYDVAVLPDGTVRAFIADATGHGVTAALSTMLIKSEYDALKDAGEGPAKTLAALNERITRSYAKLAVLFTAAIVDIAPDQHHVRYTCGGHPGPMLVRRDAVVELDDGGPFVGVKVGLEFPEWSASLAGWQGLALLTDGVTEARNKHGEQFGEARLRSALDEATRRKGAITERVMTRLDAHLGTQAATDDITLLAFRPRA